MKTVLDAVPAACIVAIGLPAGWILRRRHGLSLLDLSTLLVTFSMVAWLQAAQFAVVLALLAWMAEVPRCPRENLEPGPLDIPLLIYLGLAVTAAFTGVSTARGLFGLKSLFVLLLIPLLTRQPWNHFRLHLHLTTFMAGAAIGIVTHGIRFLHLAWETDSLRAAGAMSFAGLALVLAAFFITLAFPFSDNPSRLTAAVLALLAAAFMVLQSKRGIWLAALLAPPLVALIAARRNRWLVLPAIAFAILLPATLLFTSRSAECLRSIASSLDDSSKIRLDLWRTAASLALEYPFGAGVRTEEFLIGERLDLRYDHFHNNFLNVAVTTGLAGLLAWSWWMARFFILARQTRFQLPDDLALGRSIAFGAMASAVCWLLAGCFEYTFGDSRTLLFILWLMGVTAGLHRCFWAGGGPDALSASSSARPVPEGHSSSL
ncbi:MAG: O-antigen ligase family protein [Planctomycetes bacterium]|nr:O-antigen ligase family protein [Planctomycetota bacterium]